MIVTREIESQNQGAEGGTLQNVRSDLILQNIRVLAIDASYAPPLVSAEDGEGANVGSSAGSLNSLGS